MNVNAIAISVSGIEKYLVWLNSHTTYVADANPTSVSSVPGSPRYSSGCFSIIIPIIRVITLAACVRGFWVLASLWYRIVIGTSVIRSLF